MELIKFEDSCVISRADGYDENGGEVFKEVYNDKCNYQQGVQTYREWSQHNSVVVLPGDVRIHVNDVAIVTEENGVKHECKVNNVRNVKLPITGERFTRLEMEYDKAL